MKSLASLFIFVLLASLLSLRVPASADALFVTHLTVVDRGNYGNGADIYIEFTLSNSADEVRIYVVPDENDVPMSDLLTSENYSFVKAVEAETLTKAYLGANALTIDGTPIVEDTGYVVYVAVLADGELVLAEASAEIILFNEAIVFTVVPELDAAAGGLETDADGNIYFADFGEQNSSDGTRVYKITPTGDVSVFLEGNGLRSGTGNAFDADGNFYQSSFRENVVLKVAPDGTVTTFADDELNGPVGITIDDAGNLFVPNCNLGVVTMISPEGVPTRFSVSASLRCGNGITIDDDNNLYVSNFRDSNIVKITPEGDSTVLANLSGRNNSHILYHDGILYAVSRDSHQVFTVTLDGEFELLAGTGERGNADGPLLEASFALPNDIAMSPDGRILYLNEVLASTDGVNYPSVIRGIALERTK